MNVPMNQSKKNKSQNKSNSKLIASPYHENSNTSKNKSFHLKKRKKKKKRTTLTSNTNSPSTCNPLILKNQPSSSKNPTYHVSCALSYKNNLPEIIRCLRVEQISLTKFATIWCKLIV